MRKVYKILGDSFKQYRYLSSNTFEEGKTNIITDKNIEELIDSFNNREVDVFVYHGHKVNYDDERVPIGKIVEVHKSKDSVGLEAVIEFYDNASDLLDSKGFYPSIEMVGKKLDEGDDNISWANCELKALALVEYPASKNVDLLCASGIIETIPQKGEKTMEEKLQELITKMKGGDEEAKKEFMELLKTDDTLSKAVLTFLLANEGATKIPDEPPTPKKDDEPPAPKDEPENKDDEEAKKEVSLSAMEFDSWANEYAESKNGIRCSSQSVELAFNKAKRLHKGGFNKDEIMEMVGSTLVPIGISSKTTEVNLSALSKDKQMEEIANMFK